MENPIFSIVIVNFNHGTYLEQAINSILSQSFKRFELIIIDGGSSDNSLSVIEKYSSRLAYWISEKDNGQSDAFNKGFKKSIGEFLFWINADDRLLPNSLEIAFNHIQKFPKFKWFAANTVYISPDNRILKCARGLKWKDYLIKNSRIYVYGPTSIFHRTLFQEVGCFDESLHYSMDTDLWIRFMKSGYRFKRIRNYFWAFRIHKNSKTSHSLIGATSTKMREEQTRILAKNGHIYTASGNFRQKIFKYLLGTYLMSFYDTLIFKGKHVSQLKN